MPSFPSVREADIYDLKEILAHAYRVTVALGDKPNDAEVSYSLLGDELCDLIQNDLQQCVEHVTTLISRYETGNFDHKLPPCGSHSNPSFP